LVSLYLLLKLFTSRSFPLENPLSLLFKVRQPLGYWVFKEVNYPNLCINNNTFNGT
jgi:hypothetical protein